MPLFAKKKEKHVKGRAVRCTCGRIFKNVGKLSRHVEAHKEDPIGDNNSMNIHAPDRNDPTTEKQYRRYLNRRNNRRKE